MLFLWKGIVSAQFWANCIFGILRSVAFLAIKVFMVITIMYPCSTSLCRAQCSFQAISKVVEGFVLPLFYIILNICYMKLSILRNSYNLQLYFRILQTETLSFLKYYFSTGINNSIYVQINFVFFKLYLLQAEVKEQSRIFTM